MIKIIEQAKKQYEDNGLDIYKELRWHHDNGWVIQTPEFFGMGYFIKDDGVVLHVSYCNGDMRALFRFSSDYVLDKIEFKRNFTGEVKRYNFAKFEQRMNHG